MKYHREHCPKRKNYKSRTSVATLALGSRPRQGVARLRAKREAWESCSMLLRV
jgi:hypothetical protein